MAIFTGSGVAIVTPFKENKEVDYDRFKELIEFQIANGTDCIIVCGTCKNCHNIILLKNNYLRNKFS